MASSSSCCFTNNNNKRPSFKIFKNSSSCSSRSALVCWCIFFCSFFTSHSLSFYETSLPVSFSSTNIAAATPAPSYYLTPLPAQQQGKLVNTHHNHHQKKLIIILTSVVLVSALFLTALMAFFFKCLQFKSKSKKRVEDAEDPIGFRVAVTTHISISEPAKKIKDSDDKLSYKLFSWDEIQRLTRGFSTSSVIGEGGFSTVYLAHFPDSTLGAIKIPLHNERLNRLFKQELEILHHVRHDNIVNFIGYSNEQEDESALVFEYVSNGTLHEKIHGKEQLVVLPWKTRMSIAYQLARAIEYLHDHCSLQIVHGDIKASNVLLDDSNNCKLCDFGFAKMGFSSTIVPSSINPLVGSPGYMDPYYLRTGIASKKNDVYSFGVIVLELITGIEAFCPEKEQLLMSIAGPILRDVGKVVETVDARLAGDFNAEEAIAMASISALCLRQQASLRPSMAEISERISSHPSMPKLL
ncbi:hypothetical protein GIB67_033266 [Kingdonia uniflora]|uniref:Protein kinase domain-containing protein n=1 Tax=Kingdonia uniflora TaxID=39325 RepID=A0A7J7MPQ3_9MAGN|nr:hypothetical protein GIB67_033266 [Kingdonia uniflora]